ncbi:MAG: phosphodiester glycosidase family protein, partial [Anaerolineae bacterium]
LTRDNRLLLGGALGRPISTPFAFAGFDAKRNLIPVDRLGFLREFVWHERPRVAFNAAFFLLEHDDFFSHHSALGEAYNLYVHNGVILRPPLYRRAALYQAADLLAGSGQARWQAGYFSVADVVITLPDGTTLVPEGSKLAGLPFALNPENSAEIAVYTRASGLASGGRPLCRTPVEPGRLEFTLVDRRVVGHKTGGSLDIPQNGLVLSFHPAALPAGAIPDGRLPCVRYSFVQKKHCGIRQAIQVGPMLLQDGEVVVSSESLATEEFWPTPLDHTGPDDIGVVPTDYPNDTDRTRAGRIGLGIDSEGGLVVVAVPGTERGTRRPDADSSGATLLELAELLAQAGAVDAINLDGGGSTQLFYLGGLTTTPGNRYRLPGVQFERMIPSAGVLR